MLVLGRDPGIDIAEVQTAEGKLRLFVAIDRTSKFAYAELYEKAGKMVAAQFLRNLIAAVPYSIHTVLTDNGIEHRLTKINHPWSEEDLTTVQWTVVPTNGQSLPSGLIRRVERMNRTIKSLPRA